MNSGQIPPSRINPTRNGIQTSHSSTNTRKTNLKNNEGQPRAATWKQGTSIPNALNPFKQNQNDSHIRKGRLEDTTIEIDDDDEITSIESNISIEIDDEDNGDIITFQKTETADYFKKQNEIKTDLTNNGFSKVYDVAGGGNCGAYCIPLSLTLAKEHGNASPKKTPAYKFIKKLTATSPDAAFMQSVSNKKEQQKLIQKGAQLVKAGVYGDTSFKDFYKSLNNSENSRAVNAFIRALGKSLAQDPNVRLPVGFNANNLNDNNSLSETEVDAILKIGFQGPVNGLVANTSENVTILEKQKNDLAKQIQNEQDPAKKTNLKTKFQNLEKNKIHRGFSSLQTENEDPNIAIHLSNGHYVIVSK